MQKKRQRQALDNDKEKSNPSGRPLSRASYKLYVISYDFKMYYNKQLEDQ